MKAPAIATHIEKNLLEKMVFVAGPRQCGKTTMAEAILEKDIEGVKAELRYFRTPVGHEVDFLVVRGSTPWMAVEVKLDDNPLDRGLKYLLERVKVPHAFQVSLNGTKDWRPEDINGCRIRILPASKLLANLP